MHALAALRFRLQPVDLRDLGEVARVLGAPRELVKAFLVEGHRRDDCAVPHHGARGGSCPLLVRSKSRVRAPAAERTRAPAGRGPTDTRHSRHARSRSHHGHRAATVTS
jgi:hypothetical protein